MYSAFKLSYLSSLKKVFYTQPVYLWLKETIQTRQAESSAMWTSSGADASLIIKAMNPFFLLIQLAHSIWLKKKQNEEQLLGSTTTLSLSECHTSRQILIAHS